VKINGRLGYFMISGSASVGDGFLAKLRNVFRPRDLMIHDGAAMRRVHISTKVQLSAAGSCAAAAFVATFGIAQFAFGTTALTNAIGNVAAQRAEVSQMEARVAALQADVITIKSEAKRHAVRLEARQAFLAAMLKGEDDPAKLAALLPADAGATPDVAADIARTFNHLDQDQAKMAFVVRSATEARYRDTAQMIAKLGISSARINGQFMGGVGGPYEPVPATPSAPITLNKKADPQFRELFNSWRRLDQLQGGIVAIPSAQPVQSMTLTSNFGVRIDPFRGGRAMHAGVDIPGAYATPIYATADAVVGRTGWIGGYGNLVELEHGKGIQTRYGHLSSILVGPGKRIKRGDLIGLMGSTGRSTGNHLHYEVRIDGRAVNPTPFLQTNNYLQAMQRRATGVAMGGPVENGAVTAGAK
jgi:murein DD-endopeptidase MepM/ murein hydrolase activator NlpD